MIGLKVKNGIVVNTAVFDSINDVFKGWIVAPSPTIGSGFTDNGDGTFSPPVIIQPKLAAEELAVNGRSWRNRELRRADIEIAKLFDVAGDASAWSVYRILLRDWPTDPVFPDPISRPMPPDT